MTIKLKEVLQLNHFDGATILTDIPLQEDFLVEAISVQEFPVEEFVRKNEIILTTCMSCDDMEIFSSFVNSMSRLDATALIIAMGCYVKEIPDEIIEIAEKNNLVIITIPWEVRFSNIVEEVFDLLNKEKDLQIEKYRILKDRLISLFLDRSEINNALDFIEASVRVPCAIYDYKGTLIDKSTNYDEKVEDSLIYSYKINHNDIIYANLKMDMRNRDMTRLDKVEFDNIINHNIINPILLWFERNQVIYEMELHHKEKFILNLIDQEENDWEKIITEGKTYGFNLDKSFIALVAKVDFDMGLKEEEVIKTLKDLAIRIAKADNRECLVAHRNTFLIIFLENQGETLEYNKAFVRKYNITIKNIYPELSLVWGIGGTYEGINTIYYSYMDAIMSLRNGLKYGKDMINTMNTTLEYQVFIELSKNKVITDIVEKVLSELHEDSNMELVNTLNEYYLNNRNISKTAENIFLHRQSLNYRLKKIESLTNLSLDDPRESFLLELCIKMHYFNTMRKL